MTIAGSGVFAENQCILVTQGASSPLATLSAVGRHRRQQCPDRRYPIAADHDAEAQLHGHGNPTSNPVLVNGCAPWRC